MTKIEAKPALSPDELLKAVVAGKADPKPEPAPAAPRFPMPSLAGIDLRRYAIPGAALAVGLLRCRRRRPLRLGQRAERCRRGVERHRRCRTDRDRASRRRHRAAPPGPRGSPRRHRHRPQGSRRPQLRVGRTPGAARQELNAKTAALGERLEQVEREQSGRIANLATQLERRTSAAAIVKAEPTQTEASPRRGRRTRRSRMPRPSRRRPAEAKPKPAVAEKPSVIDGWAVRDVYDGAAILENRRRRIVEVGPGDTLRASGGSRASSAAAANGWW